MTPMNEELHIARGLPLDDPDFANHEDYDIFCALGVDLRGHEPECDGADVEECNFQCGVCERICELEEN